MQKLISFDDALQHMTSKAPTPKTVVTAIDLKQALHHVLAKDILSAINVPPADNSAMDGYAIHTASLNTEGSTAFRISQRIPAGTVGSELEPGTAARIFTGAFVPPDANAVIMQEKVTIKNGHAVISAPVPEGDNIRLRGEDIQKGHTVLTAGTKMTAADLGLAASIGISALPVYDTVCVAIMCTGDELVEPGSPVKPGQIYNSNRYMLNALLTEMGCEVYDLGSVKDHPEATESALKEAASHADLIISSGGVSVGEEDYVKSCLEKLGQLEIWKLALKPGKPLAFGQIDKTPFLGLPGNPVSVFATFSLLARPFIQTMQGMTETALKTLFLPLDLERPKPGMRREFIRVRLEQNKGQLPVLKPLAHQGSGILSSVSNSDGLAVIMENQAYKSGNLVEYIPYPQIRG